LRDFGILRLRLSGKNDHGSAKCFIIAGFNESGKTRGSILSGCHQYPHKPPFLSTTIILIGVDEPAVSVSFIQKPIKAMPACR